MSAAIALRGSGWHSRPTWRLDLNGEVEPRKVWSGYEILVDADGEILRGNDADQIGRGVGFCALIQRQAPLPDHLLPANEREARA